VKVKIILFITLLLMAGCVTTEGYESKWRNMGPDQVQCQKHEFKMCGRYGSLHICECKLA